jgi:mono/diheme cytochrome c family protein
MQVKVLGLALIIGVIASTHCIAAEKCNPAVTRSDLLKPLNTSHSTFKASDAGYSMLIAAVDPVAEPAATPATTSDGFALPPQKKKLGDAPPAPKDAITPLDRVKASPIGTLKNPYAGKEDMVIWGKQRYMGNSCNGCHGGTGGGGMCPPLSNETWVYGSDDDTLFRLIALGSDNLQKHLGTGRKGRESVVGPMPAFGEIIKTDDEIWRIISFIRSVYRGDPTRDPRNTTTPAVNPEAK